MRRVLHFIRPYLIFVITGLLCTVVSVVTQLLVPIFCGDAIDVDMHRRRQTWILQVLSRSCFGNCGGNRNHSSGAMGIVSFVITESFSAFPSDLRNAAIGKIQTLPLSYLDVTSFGRLGQPHHCRC